MLLNSVQLQRNYMLKQKGVSYSGTFQKKETGMTSENRDLFLPSNRSNVIFLKSVSRQDKQTIKEIEQLTEKKATFDYEKLKYLTTTSINDEQNNPVKVFAFISKNIDKDKENSLINLSLFTPDKQEVGYVQAILNKVGEDSREAGLDRNVSREGKELNPYVSENKKYVYLSSGDNFFNVRRERTMHSCSSYSKRPDPSAPRYKGVITKIYQLLGGYLKANKLDCIAGMSGHAKIDNGSLAAHKKIGFSEYDKTIYIEDRNGNDAGYRGIYLKKD